MRPEIRALLWLLNPSPSEHRERHLVAMFRRGLQWERLAAAAERAEITPFLLFQLRRLELGNLVPAAIVERLTFTYEATALRNGLLVRNLERAESRLA